MTEQKGLGWRLGDLLGGHSHGPGRGEDLGGGTRLDGEGNGGERRDETGLDGWILELLGGESEDLTSPLYL